MTEPKKNPLRKIKKAEAKEDPKDILLPRRKDEDKEIVFENLDLSEYKESFKYLSLEEKAFVEEYFSGLKEAEASLRSQISKYRKKLGGRNSMALKPRVQNAIRAVEKAFAKFLGATPEKTLNEYYNLATSDINDFFVWKENGEVVMKNFDDLSPQQTRAIQSIKFKRGRGEDGEVKTFIEKITLYNKLPALDALAKYFGLFREDNQQKRPVIDLDMLIACFPEQIQPMIRAKLTGKLLTDGEGQQKVS